MCEAASVEAAYLGVMAPHCVDPREAWGVSGTTRLLLRGVRVDGVDCY